MGTPFAGPVNFTITDGSIDFAAGDSFVIAASQTDVVKLCSASATDGSQQPHGIVVRAADASVAPVRVMVYELGAFDESQLSIGAGLTVSDVRDALRVRGIRLIAVSPT